MGGVQEGFMRLMGKRYCYGVRNLRMGCGACVLGGMVYIMGLTACGMRMNHEAGGWGLEVVMGLVSEGGRIMGQVNGEEEESWG